jgi:hypothetical protein
MTIEQAQRIASYMEGNLNCEAEVREDYSGRGMYGKTVPAIVTDNAVALGYAAGVLGIPDEDLPTRRDSMGLGFVFY